jgi:hypothetical protein
MRTGIFTVAKILMILLSAFLLAEGWWYMWMYHGWIGTPRVLHQFVFSDGESSYDNTLYEMMVISLVAVIVLYSFGPRLPAFIRKVNPKTHTSKTE